MAKVDKDLEFYRDLMKPPEKFQDGFSWSSLLGAMFIAVVMVPGSIYMMLMQGQGVGGAAQWVMVILFIEIAKRTHQSMSRPQIFVLFYMTGAAMGMPFFGLLYNQYLVRSEAIIGYGMQDMIPSWVAPTDPEILAQRTFFHPAWLPVIGMVLFTQFISRLDNAILGYGMFKIASDIEKLPFPMAPIGAQGITALAEDLEEKETGASSQRWRIFSVGGAIGLVFGFLYLGVPALSGALLNKTITIFPIPWADWTGRTQSILPAVATGFSYNLGSFIIGTVIPFWAVMGGVIGTAITFILNPILVRYEFLRSWGPGDSTLETVFKNRVDFYFSFGLGISAAIAAIGIGSIIKAIHEKKKHGESEMKVEAAKDTESRGDISFGIVGLVYLFSTLCYILVSGFLIGWHRGMMIVLMAYGLFYTPLISYATARLEGMIGQAIAVPFVREAGILLSGYQGLACWFVPLPLHDYGRQTTFYRQAELTGTRVYSIWKTEALLVPFVLLSSIFYAQLIWSMGEIPSSAYPHAEALWGFNARNQVLIFSATTGGYSTFQQAFSLPIIGSGFGAAMLMFFVLKGVGAPVFLLFGAIRGLDQTMPHAIPTEALGALFARFYLEKKFGGMRNWRRVAPVLSAGFGCGMGLVAMFTIGVKFMTTAVITTQF